MKQLFPKEIIEFTNVTHHFEHQTKSKIIYTIILTAMVITLVILPLVKINIYTTARGMLKPNKERVQLTSLQSGKITAINMRDNQQVQKGDTLLMINSSLVHKKLQRSDTKLNEIRKFITDCEYLINTKTPDFSKIKSVRYQKEYIYFSEKVQELKTTAEKNQIDYLRNKSLFDKGVIAKVDYEESKYQNDLAINTLKQYQKQQKKNWQTQITEYKNSVQDLEGDITQLEQNQKELVVTAPSTGVLKNVIGLDSGSFIISGNTIAEISPDTELIAECYLSPSDIGLINAANPVNFQIDAFNYNQWGLASGKVIEISKDIDIIEQQPMFKIRCALDQKHLSLKNGFQGSFNKGMTLNARFQLTERSLFDLLYDKVDDWLNPSSPVIAQIQK